MTHSAAADDVSIKYKPCPFVGSSAGGLTTIEEKAFGNFQKIGNCKFIDVLEPAEEPTKGKGLYFMDTSSAAAECVTLQAAAGWLSERSSVASFKIKSL